MRHFIDKLRKPAGATALAALLIASVAFGVNNFATAAEGQLGFTLVAVDIAPTINGVKPILILSGHGTFTPNSVTGGGGYLYADGATETPKKILSNGTWEATQVLRWTPAEGGATYGRVNPGILDLRIDLIPDQGPVIKGAVLRINCNVGLAGIKNKDPDTGVLLAEGYWLTIPTSASFGPTTAVGQFVPKDPILGVTEISR